MGLPVTIKVNFRGNVKRFLAQDLDKLEWDSVEAWIKASFGINHFQVKYFDEDNEEICINSQDEYEEAIKSADKQGNQLHMNVYKMKGQACGGPLKTEVKELKGDLRPAPPYPSRVKTVDKGTQVTPEKEAARNQMESPPLLPLVAVKDSKGTKQEDPPMWFRSYMEKFKDEVVKEVVERMCNDFSGQCCTHKSPDGPAEVLGASGGPIGPRPGPSTSNGSLGYTPNCSSCNKLTSEGAYKCSVCPSCILCELCRHSHDPSHNLVRTKTPLSIPEHGMSGELRFPRRGDRTVRKAERQRLKAERRQLRAEVKEIKKKLRLEKRGLQWSGPSTSGRANLTNMASASTQVPALPPSATSETASGPTPAQGPVPAPAPDPQASSPEGPGVSHTSLVPTMAALFLDENLPDGTRLEPGTKFIKYWKMRNSGTISWTSETKLVFMWGNLGLASEDKREVPVPLLLPGQVGVVSVAFVAPVMEGTYTSHWRLAHCGCQFGPRVWCSIVVDPGDGRNALELQSKRLKEQLRPVEKEKEKEIRSKDSGTGLSVDLSHEDFYFPSVDLLTAQDLLSFELLDINIVQELEKVPNNTPEDLTPCISPLPHDAHMLDKPAVALQIKDHLEVTGVRKLFGVKLGHQRELLETVAPEEEKEEEISGAQFLCETVIRSLTLEEAPDHRPLRRAQHSTYKPQVVSRGPSFCLERAAVTEKTEGVHDGNEEVCAIRAESLAPPPSTGLNQTSQEITPAPMLEPEIENLHGSSQHDSEDDDEDEEVVVLDDMQNMKDTQEKEGGTKGEDWDEVSSQTSSVSSCDDYIIVLPDCFDTSRPLGESMYSSAMSQPDTAVAVTSASPDQQQQQQEEEEDEEEEEEEEEEEDEESDSEPEREAPPIERQEQAEEAVAAENTSLKTWPLSVPPIHSSVNQMLCASQTLDAVTLTPEVVPPPVLPDPLLPPPALYSPRSEALYLAEDPSPPVCEAYEPQQPRVHLNVSSGLSRSAGSASSAFETYNPRPSNALQPRGQGGITEGFVKGALSVAASAYKALFTGPNCSIQRGIDPATRQDPSLMAMLLEMGFRDQRLNQRLLRKHGYSLLHTVNELVQIAEDSQNRAVDTQH
ncbi:NBR1 autophagy cargo receptor a [Scomber scombrus]|uniref:NBR1 autophagy cargo receptor a n=1 Tax=Scomber scombrus TaxID=13677 RepID=UPI002DD884BE|nr:NBR1 autophagy cargo receptor a [Scomber scombrus]XP_062298023.1 NBR1 autophagy cargo receptor a [Scomber scombrus]